MFMSEHYIVRVKELHKYYLVTLLQRVCILLYPGKLSQHNLHCSTEQHRRIEEHNRSLTAPREKKPFAEIITIR